MIITNLLKHTWTENRNARFYFKSYVGDILCSLNWNDLKVAVVRRLQQPIRG